MKIGRAKTGQGARYFVVIDGKRHALPVTVEYDQFNPFELESVELLRRAISDGKIGELLSDELPLLSPIVPAELLCVGMNYRAHAIESGADPDKFIFPTLFGRGITSVNSPNGDVVVPAPCSFPGLSPEVQLDYEIELAVVIGRRCYNVEIDEALDYVSGYMVANDLSERWRQTKLSSQWLSGKSLPTTFPVGPFFVTADEVGDPQALNMELKVNGDVRQSSSTEEMIFSVAKCVSAISQTRLMLPGTVISTGTPAGVVLKAKPELVVYPWLKAGDIMELRIWNQRVDLGTQRQVCVAQTPERLQAIRDRSLA